MTATIDPSKMADPEAEAAIISAVLIDNSTIGDVLEILKPADCYRTAHQRIFSAITDLHHQGEPADLLTVRARLEQGRHAGRGRRRGLLGKNR